MTIDGPQPDNWFAVAFISWTDPNNDRIEQQGNYNENFFPFCSHKKKSTNTNLKFQKTIITIYTVELFMDCVPRMANHFSSE